MSSSERRASALMILSSSPLVLATIAADARRRRPWQRRQRHRRVLDAQGVAGLRVGQLGDDADVAGNNLGHGDDRLAVGLAQLREPLLLAESRGDRMAVAAHRAAQHLEERDLAEGVDRRLEDEARTACRPGRRRSRSRALRVERRRACARSAPGGSERCCRAPCAAPFSVAADGADDRHQRSARRRGVQRGAHLLIRELGALEVLLEQRVVTLRSCVDQRGVRALDLRAHLVGDGGVGSAAAIVELVGAVIDEVDVAAESVGSPDRDRHRDRLARERLAQRVDRGLVGGVLLVHAVHDDERRERRPPGSSPRPSRRPPAPVPVAATTRTAASATASASTTSPAKSWKPGASMRFTR